MPTEVAPADGSPSWGQSVILAMLLVLTGAGYCVGFAVASPPWRGPLQADIALVWQHCPDTLAENILRIHVYTATSEANPRSLCQRFVLHGTLWIDWDGCGVSETLAALETVLLRL